MQIERNGFGPWPVVDVSGVQVRLSVGEEFRVFDCAVLQGALSRAWHSVS